VGVGHSLGGASLLLTELQYAGAFDRLALFEPVVSCSVVQRGAAWCSVVQRGAVFCSVVCCSVVPCGAVWCSVVQCVAV